MQILEFLSAKDLNDLLNYRTPHTVASLHAGQGIQDDVLVNLTLNPLCEYQCFRL